MSREEEKSGVNKKERRRGKSTSVKKFTKKETQNLSHSVSTNHALAARR